jgi:hypothetical protein
MKTPQLTLILALTSIIFLATESRLMAQSNKGTSKDQTSETTGPRRFWQAKLPGGSYIVALDRISSISKHSYIIDGGLRVTEVVIDTSGNSLVRFYYIIPLSEDSGSAMGAGITSRAKELLDKAGERTGINANTVVAKQYPTTTHAKTVEYRISDESHLDQLFNSARKAWINGTGKKFTIKE